MARKKIGRATNVSRPYGYDDQRYERNARVQAAQNRPGTTQRPSPNPSSGGSAAASGGSGSGSTSSSSNGGQSSAGS